MQLCRKLGAGRTRAYDGNLKLLRAQRVGLRVAANISIDQPRVKTRGLDRRIERSRTPGVPKSLLSLPTAMISVS